MGKDINYWLVKSEPEAYSWERFVKEGKAVWDGVRNYQARNNMKEMKKGDLVMFYHSVSDKVVVGYGEVSREHYPDPTIDDPRWVVVELKPREVLKRPVSLARIKQDDRLEQIALVKQARLSVMPLKKEEFDIILLLAEEE